MPQQFIINTGCKIKICNIIQKPGWKYFYCRANNVADTNLKDNQMNIAPLRAVSITMPAKRIPFQALTSKNDSETDNNRMDQRTKIVSGVIAAGVLAAGGILLHRHFKAQKALNTESRADEYLNTIQEDVIPQIIRNIEKSKNLPKGLPASVNTYSPISISQRISQYKANVNNFIKKELLPVSNRGTVQALPLENFHKWEDAAKRLNNVTKQAVTDTYKSFKICLNTFKKRYGLQDREIGFIKEAMNMFTDRTKMAMIAKEDIDQRILNKQITPEQLFAEKISSAFVPSMETDNAAVIKNLLTKVAETINY